MKSKINTLNFACHMFIKHVRKIAKQFPNKEVTSNKVITFYYR